MRLFIILIILILGCRARPMTMEPMVPIPLPTYSPIMKVPIKAMDSLHYGMQEKTVALVKIIDEDGEKTSKSYCGGIWVGIDEILTAAHCVREDNNPTDYPVGREVTYIIKREILADDSVTLHYGVIVSYDGGHDLALIQTNDIPEHWVAIMATELPAIGDKVYSVGHPSELSWTFISGEVSAYRKVSSLGDSIQVNMSIWYGHSGGGLFDWNGKLIGICAQKHQIPSMGYFVHLDHIKSFLWESRLKR